MKKNLNKLGVALFSFAILSSCERDADLSKINTEQRLVVNALINNRESLSFQLTKSVALTEENNIQNVTNAQVYLIDEADNRMKLNYNPLTERYVLGFVPLAGRSYSLLIAAPGFQQIESKTILPGAGLSNKPTWKDSTAWDKDGFPLGSLFIPINDDASRENYYRVSINYWNSTSAEWVPLKISSSDPIIVEDAIQNKDGSIVINDEQFNGKFKTFNFQTPFGFTGQNPKFLIKTENLSKEYYDYFRSLDRYTEASGFFDEPTAVFTNIRNGLGIFAGSTVRLDTIK